MKKWQEDLIKDIRTNSNIDDFDSGVFFKMPDKPPHEEFTRSNHDALQEAINSCIIKPKYFLEIGVHRNGQNSSTHTILKNLPEDGKYLGVDIEDKTFLDNPQRGIYTIQTSSSNYNIVIDKLNSIGVQQLDFIFIDGWHSINQVLDDWEYVNLLSDYGAVAFHDTTLHPGPFSFIYNLNTDKWKVFPNLCPLDHGFGYCRKRI